MRSTDAAAHGDRAHRTAIAAYLGLCTFMDHQVGRVLDALEDSGQAARTRIVYTSDHGENAGNRGMWGKSNHYEESGGIPLIVAGPDIPSGQVKTTPANLVDIHPTVLHATGQAFEQDGTPGRSLLSLAQEPDDPERISFSEYHAARSPSGSFMVRKGRYKLIYYVGFEHELFDLDADPEETVNLAADPAHADTFAALEAALRAIVDPEDADRRANDAQKALVMSRGGPEKVMANLVTTKSYTPVPDGLVD